MQRRHSAAPLAVLALGLAAVPAAAQRVSGRCGTHATGDLAASLALALALALANVGCAPAARVPSPPAADLAITGATLVEPESGTALADRTVLVAGDRIVAIGPAAATPVPAGARVVDGNGRFLIPGLWDMHVHLEHFPGPELLPLFLRNGVTGVRNMDGRPHLLEWRAAIAAGTLAGPRLVTAGPLLDGDPPVLDDNTVVRDVAEARAAVLEQAAHGYDFVKVYSNLSPEAYGAVLEAAAEVGLRVAGHLPRGVELAAALAAGHGSIEHLADFGRVVEAADSPHRGRFHWSKLYLAAPADSAAMEQAARMVADAGGWVVPTLVQTDRALAPADSLEPWVATAASAGVPSGAVRSWEAQARRGAARLDADDWEIVRRGRENRAAMLRALHSAGAGLMVGTDTPNPFVVPGAAVHDELELFVRAGIPPAEALLMATHAPTRFLGLAGYGPLAPGRIADLVLLEADPLQDIRNARRVVGVVVGGRWHGRAELAARARPHLGREAPDPLGMTGFDGSDLRRANHRRNR